MKLEVNENNFIILREIYSGVVLETAEGNAISVCMRDDTFEINVIPVEGESCWHRVNMQTNSIHRLYHETKN